MTDREQVHPTEVNSPVQQIAQLLARKMLDPTSLTGRWREEGVWRMVENIEPSQARAIACATAEAINLTRENTPLARFTYFRVDGRELLEETRNTSAIPDRPFSEFSLNGQKFEWRNQLVIDASKLTDEEVWQLFLRFSSRSYNHTLLLYPHPPVIPQNLRWTLSQGKFLPRRLSLTYEPGKNACILNRQESTWPVERQEQAPEPQGRQNGKGKPVVATVSRTDQHTRKKTKRHPDNPYFGLTSAGGRRKAVSLPGGVPADQATEEFYDQTAATHGGKIRGVTGKKRRTDRRRKY